MFEDNHDCSPTTTLVAPYFCLARFSIIQNILALATQLSFFYRGYFHAATVYASGHQIYPRAVQHSRCCYRHFLGFRNNAGYARYVEARKLWGQLMIASRSLLREVKTTLPDSASVKEFVRLQIAFAHCLRMTLRKLPQAKVLAHYLNEEDLQRVQATNSPANHILLMMGKWLAVQRRNGQLSDILFISLNDRLNDISAVLAGCERIAYTPIPFAYTLILHRTVYLFCIMLPFALVVDLHYMTPFISVLISYTFISLDCLAEELEDPFGTENNDLPLDAICNAIEIDLLQMNDETEIPPKILPDRHYQLT